MIRTAAAQPASTTRNHWLYGAVPGLLAFVLLTWWIHHIDGPTGLDEAVLATTVRVRTTPLTIVATAVTGLGSTVGVIIAGFLAALLLLWRTRRLLLPLILTIAVVETAAVVFLTKELIARDRPPTEWLIGAPAGDPAFPSGHTTNGSVVYVLSAIYLATTLAHRWSRALLVASGVLTGLAIGLSRVYLGYHWATDVLGGWLLAIAVCGTASYVAARLQRIDRPVGYGAGVAYQRTPR